MTDILFRGKRLKDGEWVYGSFIPGFHESVAIEHNLKNHARPGFIKEMLGERKEWFVNRKTVGQYTGLKDKNCVRIFEGDIVDHHIQGDVLVSRGVVEWDERNGRWAHQLNTMNPDFALYNPNAFEIIGNIHDNPELLDDVKRNELKPCPFCGGKAEIVPHKFFSEVSHKWEVESYGVECQNCHTSGYQFWGCEKHAVEAWNRRAEK